MRPAPGSLTDTRSVVVAGAEMPPGVGMTRRSYEELPHASPHPLPRTLWWVRYGSRTVIDGAVVMARTHPEAARREFGASWERWGETFSMERDR